MENKAKTQLGRGLLCAITVAVALGIQPFITLGSGQKPATQSGRPQRGYTYHHDEKPDMPLSIHVLKVDRTRSELEFHTTMGGGSHLLGMGLVSDQIKAIPSSMGRPIAGINGDFYKSHRSYPGDPEGLQIVDGEVVSAPNETRVCFFIDPEGAPHRMAVTNQFHVTWPNGSTTRFGLNEERADDAVVLYTAANGPSTRTSGGVEIILESTGTEQWLPLQIQETYSGKVKQINDSGNSPLSSNTMVLSIGSDLAAKLPKVTPGTILKVALDTVPALKGVKTALGGGPSLIAEGKVRTFTGSQPRHPRTAIGWNDDYVFLVVVDGRQRNLSVGMSLPELADYFSKLGCTEAMNLDGGGSTTFWIYGNVVNSPSEGKERPAANALVVLQHEKPD